MRLDFVYSTSAKQLLGFLFTLSIFIFLLIITMFKDEITLDDIIEFIIKHRNDTEMMDEISRASFPFTSKYRNGNNWKKDWTITLSPYSGSTYTLCNDKKE